MTTLDKKFHFLIEHIDPLGQGVFKQDDKVYFIPKTLPNESGTAQIIKSRKGVNFAKLETLVNKSEKRIQPECSHYSNCQGCHYLHCDYESELEFKLNSFKRMLSFTNFEGDAQFIEAPRRFHYRNRIQLHYNKKIKKLGFINTQNNQITEVPNCQISSKLVQQEMTKLYENSNWMNLSKGQPVKGHVEIYQKDNQIELAWNKKYAHGGFTQVFNEMNIKLIDMVSKITRPAETETLLDLFGGNGNLSQNIKANKYILDFYTQPQDRTNYVHLDLMEETALDQFLTRTKIKSVDHFLIDPPRKGFEHIDKWTDKLSPRTLTYVSCHPQTMFRDIKKLKDYKIQQAYLIDLFPSTFHFEACLYLEKINI